LKELRNFKKKSDENTKAETHNVTVEEAIKKYGGMGEDALIDQLIKQVSKAKTEGRYDPNQMQLYMQMLSPHLKPEQKEKLENILNFLNTQ